MLGLGNGGVVWAELYVPSGLAAVVVASSPFWMAGVEAFRADGERLTARNASPASSSGFCGIVVLVWPDLMHGGAGGRDFLARRDRAAGRVPRLVARLVVFEAARAAATTSSARPPRRCSPAASMMLALGTVRGEWARLSFTTRSAAALVYLSTIGAIGGFVAYTYALRHLPVSFVSLYAYINPVIAVALGVAVLGEPFTSRMAARRRARASAAWPSCGRPLRLAGR